MPALRPEYHPGPATGGGLGVDNSRRALQQLDRPSRRLVEADLAQPLGQIAAASDAVLALDVIEHLDDDRAPVARLGTLVRPGGRSDRQRSGAPRAVHRVRRHSGPSPALLAGNPGRGLCRFRPVAGTDLLVGTMARAGLAATPRPPAPAPRPDTVGDLPPLPRIAPLALVLGRQTGVPGRARSGPPRAIADWYITVRGGSPPRRQGGPFGLPGNIVNVTFFHEPVRCSR